MYIPKDFRVNDPEIIRSFISENNFGVLVSSVDGSQIDSTYLPFVYSECQTFLLGHMAKANAHWRTWQCNDKVKILFQGPHCYISPTYYQSDKNVSTWNYTAVSISGIVKIVRDPQTQVKYFKHLTNHYENSRDNPWLLDEHGETFRKLIPAVQCFQVNINEVQAVFKLNQDKLLTDQYSVIKHLSASKSVFEQLIAGYMQRNYI